MGMLIDTGSSVLVEDFVYSGTLSIINPYSPVYHVVESDTGGMIPQSLRAVLSQWGKGEEAEKDRPKILYINPTGANPTGTLLSVERRKEIYQLCCEYNLLLLEDDPYYYLQFGDKESRPPSFLSLDTQGLIGLKFLPNNNWFGVNGCMLLSNTPRGLLLIEVVISLIIVLNSSKVNLKLGSILKDDLSCFTMAPM